MSDEIRENLLKGLDLADLAMTVNDIVKQHEATLKAFELLIPISPAKYQVPKASEAISKLAIRVAANAMFGKGTEKDRAKKIKLMLVAAKYHSENAAAIRRDDGIKNQSAATSQPRGLPFIEKLSRVVAGYGSGNLRGSHHYKDLLRVLDEHPSKPPASKTGNEQNGLENTGLTKQ